MGRKVVKRTYKDTRAKGEKRYIEGNRYMVRIDLVSIKPVEKQDLGLTAEFYFKVGTMRHRVRTPAKGTINLKLNEVFKPQDPITLYLMMIEKKGGGVIEIPFHMYERDVGRDDEIVETKLSVNLGQSGEYEFFEERGVRVKIKISANRTNW